ncbi:MAG TPA: tail fiber domain-containing protein [Rhodothermales bacterium]|nr:tail fiber domain-containing protein [Rhodothermales bacterium]
MRPSRLALAALAVALASLAAPVAEAQTPDPALHVRRDDQSVNEYLFRVNVNGGAVFGGIYDGGTSSGGIPAEGVGTRMMWYPEKAAFRAGEVRSGYVRYDDGGFPSITTGTEWDDANIGYHSVAFGMSSRASADYSFAAGLASVAAQQSAIAMGEANTASGAASVALGYHAHTNARQGSFVFADRSSVDLLRAGVNHSASWRVSGGFRIFTSSNLSTGVTIQSGASVSNWGQASAVISTSTGALLTTGGVWTNNSDRNRKEDFRAVDGEEILDRIRTLPITTWNYRDEADEVRHMGPMAQDFHAAFGLGGTDSTHIGTVDADGVLLASVQALEARTRALEAELAALRAERDAHRTVNAAFPALGVLALVGLAGVALRRRISTSTPRS